VKAASDAKTTARDDAQVDRAIAAASRAVEGLTRRRFYPWTGTRRYDSPGAQGSPSYRLWLDANELVSLASLTAGGEAINPVDAVLYPDEGPPYTRLEISLGSSAAFSSGDTHQNAVAITGVFGYGADETPAGALAAGINASTTACTVTNSAAVGVGSILRVGTERMIVTAKAMLTTGQTGTLTKDNAATTLTVVNGSAFFADEVILLDGERMRVEDVAGNTLVVKRMWDGTAIAAHTGATIYARRALTVERGALGTSQAEHFTADPIVKHLPPGPVHALCIAEALNTISQENSGYARQIGAGDTAREAFARGLKDLRAEVYATYARRARMRAV
jgi:hypothetical protein